jgi:hypothetical protein
MSQRRNDTYPAGTSMSTKKYARANEKQHQQLVLSGEQRVEIELAALVLQDRDREG